MSAPGDTTAAPAAQPMDLLYLVRDYFPNSRPDVVVLFGRRLPEIGVRSHLVGMGAPLPPPGWTAGREHIVVSRPGSPLTSLRGMLADLRALRGGGFDLVVVRDKIFAAALALAIVGRRRVVYWMSYPFPEDDAARAALPTGSPAYRLVLRLRARLTGWLLYRVLVPRFAHVFVQSDFMAQRVAQKSGRRGGLTAVPMGVDESMLAAAVTPRTPPAPGEPFRLVYLGALDGTRRIDFLVEVLASLQAGAGGDQRWHLTLVGSAPPAELAHLVRRIESLGVSSVVTLAGRLPMEAAWALCAQCHAGLSAIPRGELFDVSSPTKAVEYLAIGLPVVVNDIPDQQFLVESTGAGLCAPMAVEAFADAVRALRADYPRYAGRAVASRPWLIETRGYRALAAKVAAALAGVDHA